MLASLDFHGSISARIGRAVLGRELATIHDYRQRLAQYRTDVSLSFAHQSAPWITTWQVVLITYSLCSHSHDLSLGLATLPLCRARPMLH